MFNLEGSPACGDDAFWGGLPTSHECLRMPQAAAAVHPENQPMTLLCMLDDRYC